MRQQGLDERRIGQEDHEHRQRAEVSKASGDGLVGSRKSRRDVRLDVAQLERLQLRERGMSGDLAKEVMDATRGTPRRQDEQQQTLCHLAPTLLLLLSLAGSLMPHHAAHAQDLQLVAEQHLIHPRLEVDVDVEFGQTRPEARIGQQHMRFPVAET